MIGLVPVSSTKGKLGRLCVLKKYRQKGFGRILVQALEDHAKQQGLNCILLHAQVDKIGFYESMGYSQISNELFMEDGIEHVVMNKTL